MKIRVDEILKMGQVLTELGAEMREQAAATSNRDLMAMGFGAISSGTVFLWLAGAPCDKGMAGSLEAALKGIRESENGEEMDEQPQGFDSESFDVNEWVGA